MFYPNSGWHGFADAKPSETIQAHDLPGLAVAVVFPFKPNTEFLNIPVRQFKDYQRGQKARQAIELRDWLNCERQKGLRIAGFAHAHTQIDAAKLGLEMMEELPGTRVERHYDSFRLCFGDEQIDFPQAVALQYYFFTIHFGILRTGTLLSKGQRALFVAMDRFPGRDTNDTSPRLPCPTTQGQKFIDFISSRSSTALGMIESNKAIELTSKLGTIDWWRSNANEEWKRGKAHPHFVLPDWLAAAAIAQEFRDEFVSGYPDQRLGNEVADALGQLYLAFKAFDIWSMEPSVLQHLRNTERNWVVPDEARKFILDRARVATITD